MAAPVTVGTSVTRECPPSFRAQKCGMVMSVTTQIIFPYMSDARAPAMDVHMTPQDAGMARSFWLILSALLIGVNGYSAHVKKALSYLLQTAAGARPVLPHTFDALL